MAHETLKNYSPNHVKLIFNGIEIGGFAEGTFIKVMRTEKASSVKAGADGSPVKIKNLNRTGSAAFTLLQTSSSNKVFADFFAVDETSQFGNIGEFILSDLNGITFAHGTGVWVESPSDVTYSKDLENREWTLLIGDLEIYNAGAVQ